MRHRKEASNKTVFSSTGGTSWTKKTVSKMVLVFIVSLLVYVTIWVQVKNAYAEALTYVASEVATIVKNVNFDYMDARNDEIKVAYSDRNHNQWSFIVSNNDYTYNAPLTFAIITCFTFCIGNKLRVFIYSLLMLAGIHVLFIFSLELLNMTLSLMAKGAEPRSTFYISMYTFFHYFVSSFITRFEPFLLGFYIYIYNFKKGSPVAA